MGSRGCVSVSGPSSRYVFAQAELQLLCSPTSPFRSLIPSFAALSILDILKRAPNPLHDLARDATRFLETQLNIARQIEASFGGIEADSRIRLRAQAANEELSWTEVEKLFTVPEGFVVEVPPVDPTASLDDEEDGEPLPPPQPTANDIPRSLRSSLQCALYFQQSLSKELPAPLLLFNSLDAPAPSPYVLPPSSSEPTPPPRAHNAPPPPPDFDSLSLGDTLTFWIETFFPSVALASIPSSQIVAAKEWLKAQAAAKEASEKGGKGRGGGGGGGGGGRGSRGGDGGRTGRGGQGGRGRGAEAGRGGGGSSIGADESRRLFVP